MYCSKLWHFKVFTLQAGNKQYRRRMISNLNMKLTRQLNRETWSLNQTKKIICIWPKKNPDKKSIIIGLCTRTCTDYMNFRILYFLYWCSSLNELCILGTCQMCKTLICYLVIYIQCCCCTFSCEISNFQLLLIVLLLSEVSRLYVYLFLKCFEHSYLQYITRPLFLLNAKPYLPKWKYVARQACRS
jgi:hypothetical protein